MKKAIFLFMTLLMCGAFLSCNKDDDPEQMTIAVTAVTITEGETYAMTVGDTHTFRATVSPTNATDKSITWSSSASSILSINAQSGVAEALTDGRATITAQAGNERATIEVTVTAATVAVESVTISPESLEPLLPEEQVQLSATVTPDNATDKSVAWESLNEDVATVDQTGLVTAVAEGEATIRATAGDQSASLNVTVLSPYAQGWVSMAGEWGYPATAFAETDDMPINSPYIHLSFSEGQCAGATLLVTFNAGTYLGGFVDTINSHFPEAATVSGDGYNILEVDLFKVGVKKIFEGKTIGEIQQMAQGEMEDILANWWTTLGLCNTLYSNEYWDISSFDYFGDIRNQQHIDYLLLDMDRMGITVSETEDPQLVPEACQLELLFNKVTGQCEEAYAYMCFSHPTGCQTFVSNYVKTGVTCTRDVGGGQGESVQITLHTISGNVFTGKMRTEIIEMTNDEIIGNVLNLCIK